MKQKWLDEMVRFTPGQLDALTNEGGRWTNRRRRQWANHIVTQILMSPYRAAVISVHRTPAGAKMARRRMLSRQPWRDLSDVTVSQRRMSGGYAALVAEYRPDPDELTPPTETESHV